VSEGGGLDAAVPRSVQEAVMRAHGGVVASLGCWRSSARRRAIMLDDGRAKPNTMAVVDWSTNADHSLAAVRVGRHLEGRVGSWWHVMAEMRRMVLS
jgi:hypothetical protein